MSYKEFSGAMRTSSSRNSNRLPLFRDETLEQQRKRREKEAAYQDLWNKRWMREQDNSTK